MELTQLRYFQTAAYYQHISRAAEELNISQPALRRSWEFRSLTTMDGPSS